MSGMETIKGKFQGLIDVLMPWEDVEVEDSKEAAGEKKQQQVSARQSHAAAQEYKVSGATRSMSSARRHRSLRRLSAPARACSTHS